MGNSSGLSKSKHPPLVECHHACISLTNPQPIDTKNPVLISTQATAIAVLMKNIQPISLNRAFEIKEIAVMQNEI